MKEREKEKEKKASEGFQIEGSAYYLMQVRTYILGVRTQVCTFSRKDFSCHF